MDGWREEDSTRNIQKFEPKRGKPFFYCPEEPGSKSARSPNPRIFVLSMTLGAPTRRCDSEVSLTVLPVRMFAEYVSEDAVDLP